MILHSLVLVVGTVLLRAPIEQHLPEPLTSPGQLSRWDDAMATLLRSGVFRADGTGGEPAAAGRRRAPDAGPDRA